MLQGELIKTCTLNLFVYGGAIIYKDKLKEIAMLAYQHVPMLSNIAHEKHFQQSTAEFEQFPILNKKVYADSMYSPISDMYIQKLYDNQLIKIKTSGTTGVCTNVYWDKYDEKKSLLSLWILRYKYYKILPQNRMCYFYPADMNVPEYFIDKNVMGISKGWIFSDNMSEIYARIVEFNPVWMILQPSLALLLCQLIEDNSYKIPSSLRYVELTGEFLLDSQRKKIQRIFECDIANQYGCKETNSIAYECPEGNLHCMSDNVYVETVGDLNEDICVTSLKNQAMPFIRYLTGDKGNIKKDFKCACGNHNPILELKNGRDDDSVKLKDGRVKPAYYVTQIIRSANYLFDDVILQFQIEQTDYNQFNFHIVSDMPSINKKIQNYVNEQMNLRFHIDCICVFKFYEKLLPQENTGKLSCFTCCIPSESVTAK